MPWPQRVAMTESVCSEKTSLLTQSSPSSSCQPMCPKHTVRTSTACPGTRRRRDCWPPAVTTESLPSGSTALIPELVNDTRSDKSTEWISTAQATSWVIMWNSSCFYSGCEWGNCVYWQHWWNGLKDNTLFNSHHSLLVFLMGQL